MEAPPHNLVGGGRVRPSSPAANARFWGWRLVRCIVSTNLPAAVVGCAFLRYHDKGTMAAVLAVACFQPSPLYILDEVDAALDEGNQAKVAQLVAQVLGVQCRCQTIAISHHSDFQVTTQATIIS
jgi:hypothetical protein